MSILTHKDDQVLIQGGPAGVNAARRMAEFRFLIGQPPNVPAFVYPPDAGSTIQIPYGAEFVSIPVYKTVAESVDKHPDINTSLIYVGANRACEAAVEALEAPGINLVSMITEGLPEKDAKILIKKAGELGKIFNGPSSIGIFSAGENRLGVVGGTYDNLVMGRLHKPGSFGIVTKSGGMLNEIMWMVSMHGDGVSTAVGVGGDTFRDVRKGPPDPCRYRRGGNGRHPRGGCREMVRGRDQAYQGHRHGIRILPGSTSQRNEIRSCRCESRSDGSGLSSFKKRRLRTRRYSRTRLF
jgi:succinyl-CoA synthetase alpha subunit